ncbi:MAG: hypothetical protein GWP18_03795, partial [Proteobacteria bacterium]|nr:hypothetical protein [Pseudomonadota bacterium]
SVHEKLKLSAITDELTGLYNRRYLNEIYPKVWDPRIVKPLDQAMLADAAQHDIVITVEDGFREGGAGTAIETALKDLGSDAAIVVLGVPIEYIPHANPDKILAEIGLNAAGVASAARKAMSRPT